ncbi:MAG TPA: hypothetical protein VGQ57_15550, partial [Polyangiaceae bacterium]|nr:hypothetical protein [Polyangiaceae bacterium]
MAGVLCFGAYFAWFASVPRGPFEFGYAPFTPEPLPYSPMRGFTYEQLWGHVARLLLLGPALVCLTFGLARLRPFTPRFEPKRLAFAAAAFGVVVAAIVMLGVLRGRAIVDDELVYRMQATFLREGRLGSPEPGVIPPDVFSVRTHAGYTGKYLPGEPLVQVLGVALGMPPLLHLPLLALLFWAWFRAVELRAGPRIAAFATIVLALSPMVSLTAATGLSETTSLAMAVFLGLGLEWARGPRPFAGAVLAALALGFGLATRVQSLLPIGAVLGPALAWALLRRRAWGALAAFAATALLGIVAIGTYNAALSGSPFTLPWYLQCSIEHYGFGRVWKYDLFEHTPWTALENLGVVLVRLNAWWLGLPCSLGVFALAALVRPRLARDRDWYAAGLAIVAFEFLYYSPGGSDTGSLYHHELVLPGSLFAASVIDATLARFPELATTGFAVHFGLGTLAFFGEQGARLARLIETIHADSDRALARVEQPALVFHETRDSEQRSAGWVFDSFPERRRGQRDAVVTFPNLPPAFRNRVMAQYPGRHCYYYRRDPATEVAELRPCAGNEALMNRPPWDADEEHPR